MNWRRRLLQFAQQTDGSTHEDGIGLTNRVDRVAAFNPAILAIRWAVTITSEALASREYGDALLSMAIWSGLLIAYTVVRTFRPIRYMGDVRSLTAVLGEVALFSVCLITTGFWGSPFILTLLTAIAVAGFARGVAFAIRVALTAAVVVTLPYLAEDAVEARVVESGQWTLVLLLVAIIAGYARRISGEADRQHNLALERL